MDSEQIEKNDLTFVSKCKMPNFVSKCKLIKIGARFCETVMSWLADIRKTSQCEMGTETEI